MQHRVKVYNNRGRGSRELVLVEAELSADGQSWTGFTAVGGAAGASNRLGHAFMQAALDTRDGNVPSISTTIVPNSSIISPVARRKRKLQAEDVMEVEVGEEEDSGGAGEATADAAPTTPGAEVPPVPEVPAAPEGAGET